MGLLSTALKSLLKYTVLRPALFMGAIYPNPTNPQARFNLTLAREQHVQVNVYDILGKAHHRRCFQGFLQPNAAHSFSRWKAICGQGAKYLVRVEGDYFMTSKVFTVLK